MTLKVVKGKTLHTHNPHDCFWSGFYKLTHKRDKKLLLKHRVANYAIKKVVNYITRKKYN